MKKIIVVTNLDKNRNPFAGMVDRLENLRDLSFNGKVDIWQSRASRSPEMCLKLREVRFGNLLNRRGRNGRVALEI